MKKLYLFFVIAILGIVSASAGTFSVRVVIDNPERVTIRQNYEAVDASSGDITLEFDEANQYSNGIRIEAVSKDFFVKSVTRKNGATLGVYTDYDGTTYCDVNWSYLAADDVYTVVTGSYAELRTASCTINVDNAAGVRAQRGNNSAQLLELVDGENTVPFDPEAEKSFAFSANGSRNLYAVSHNGNPLTPSYGTYYIYDMADGDRVDVQYNYPDIKVPVTITAAEDLVGTYIQSASIDNGTTIAYNEPFQLQIGSTINFNFNTSDYVNDGVFVNGNRQSFYGSSWSYLVTEECTIEINAHPYGDINFVVNIEDPDIITLYDNSSYYPRNPLTLTAGRNELKVSEATACISFKVSNGCYVDAFIDNASGYDYKNQDYSISVSEGQEFTVRGGRIVMDNKAAIYVDGISDLPYGYNFMDSSRNTYDMADGYNFIEFASNFNPFQFNAYGWTGLMEAFLDGEALSTAYEGGTYYEFSLSNNSVLKIYLNGAPERCNVSVASDATATFAVRTDHLATVADHSSFSVHKGTHVSIHPDTKDAIVVMNGETPLTADADGIFHLDIDGNTALSVTDNATSGIESVSAATATAGNDVYSLQGVLILRDATAEDLHKLPAGLYIVGGRKQLVR